MRKSPFFFIAILSLFLCSFVSAYDGYIDDGLMEESSGSSMVTPASQSDEISVESVRALREEFLNEISGDICYEAFEEWGFVPDQRVLESAVFFADARALTDFNIDFDYDIITVGQTSDNSPVSITRDSGGGIEVRFDADFLKEYELNGKRGEVLDSIVEGYKEAAVEAVKEAISVLYDDGKGTAPVEGTGLAQLNVPEKETSESEGACLPVEYLPDKFLQEMQMSAAFFEIENGLSRLESEAAEYFQGSVNPYEGITDSFRAFADNVKYSYVNLSDLKISSGIALNTQTGMLAVDPTYAVVMQDYFHNGYASASIVSYADGLYSAWLAAQNSALSSPQSVAQSEIE